MTEIAYPTPLVERDGFYAYHEGDSVAIVDEDGEKLATVPLCGCSTSSLASPVMSAFLAGWQRGAECGRRIEKDNMATAVRTITNILKAGGLIPSND